MPTTTVDLGRITVRRTQVTNSSFLSPSLSLALSLSTSCVIDLPSTWERLPDINTTTNTQAPDIARACKEGTLWIAKAGSCQLDFSARPLSDDINERTRARGEVIDDLTLARICGLVGDCPVWRDIGLQLRDRHSSPIGNDDGSSDVGGTSTIEKRDTNVLTASSVSASYFLHHPDLSSDIHAPPSVPCAKFRGLSCKIVLSFVGDEFVKPESGRPRKQRNNATHADTPIKVNSIRYRKPQRGVGKTAKNVAQNHGNNLRRGSSLGSRIDVEDEIQGEAFTATEERSSGDDIVHYVDTVEEVGELLDAALRELIGDGRKRSKGVKVVRQAAMPSLVGIAPAVWSLGYLQSVAAHAKLIPSMATSITRLANSRSLRLRKKLKKINAATQTDISDEVTKRLWRLCQTKIRASPFLRGSRKDPPSQAVSYQNTETRAYDLFEYQQAQMKAFPHYWEEHGEYMPPPDMGFYGELTEELQMAGLHDELRPMDMDAEDCGSGSRSDVWQAEWLGPLDVEMAEYEHHDDLGKDMSTSDYDSKMDEYEGEGLRSDDTNDERYDREEEYEEEEEEDGDDDDEEDSVGEYFYADGYGNVFLVGLGESEGGEEGGYQGSEESEWDGSGCSVLEEMETGSDNGEIVSHGYGYGYGPVEEF